jgi:TnsA endonuclease-like protein
MPTKKKRTRRKRKGRYHRGDHISTKTGQVCRYRSGWELAYLQYLDAEPTVLTYVYEPFKIPYVSNKKTGKVRGYIPDVLVTRTDGSRQLVEIKPARKVMHVTVQKKLKAAQQWCTEHQITLEVLTEHELKGLGLLK